MRYGLIVEDIPEVAATLKQHLVAAFPDIQVALAESLTSARRALAETKPDILLLDIGLPDGEGSSLLTEKRIDPTTLVVITTIFDDDTHLFAALRAGANGYLLKDEPEVQLIAALQGIAEGRPPLSPAIARRIIASFTPPVQEGNLSPREVDVLSLIAKGYSLRDAAGLLGLSHNTVAGYLKTVYQKLQVNSRAEATLKAVDLGLVRPSAQ